MSNELAVISRVEATLNAGQAQLLALMPNPSPHRLARYIRIAAAEIRNNPKLLECDPSTICQSISKIIGWGLEVGGDAGEAYLIPRWNSKTRRTECQAQRGVKGLVRQVRNTGEVSAVFAEAVYRGDKFKRVLGTEPRLEHEPMDQSTEVTHVYAVCQYKDGGRQFSVMTKDQVEAHREKYSQQKDGQTWTQSFEEMAKKTVLRRLIKQLPVAISSEDDADDYVPFAVEQPAARVDVQKYERIAAAPNIIPHEDKTAYLKQIQTILDDAAAKKIDVTGLPEEKWEDLPAEQLVAWIALLKESIYGKA